MKNEKQIMNAEQMQKTLERLAYEVLERISDFSKLALIGIQRRGVDLAERIKKILEQKTKKQLDLGKLDINLYRDDWTNLASTPSINKTDIPFDLGEKDIVLVDDVLFTGRTVRAALEAILDFGRPKTIKLLVLIDRGHRELPIHADFVGKKLNTSRRELVHVLTKEHDGEDMVVLEG
ncbi:bifunctional pyr operon transcriptional regulator/uracil phosphoribosyltransferase PyrR [Desulfohalobiaceae bacterium Ax17]|jgi:pyrimidine operon attenuation protein/uracil phosphoribosyltransferase|uniref:bifunctional pyr operon transcriptional regulator/uracil phosphoribosyltransferase PyrR n=1 Tax=Desulfovulcanus ferrireducens TaxID=2831190 RepID=UPI000D56A4A4|nr:bifunctional pyr operon transcriptional regulator/uracil phosphoribosyltransferase PyrR [Desulfovulcanus ferrireducens]MBT8762431.1 bifunctional pyr operon transcriptional regulator/uracil phosphoribosyltransferase PyrR [Desulfovulcanus ferrireducens]PVU72439.1 bifunctional pyr operon transcriptional regulator/uracil phosphoribosyltransferase PyrR [Acidilobus sp. SCGC AC-742_E15]